MIEWPHSLLEDIARRRTVLFLGSGVTRNAKSRINPNNMAPTWEEFLRRALERCAGPRRHITGLISRGDFLTACEILKDRLREDWSIVLRECFVDPEFEATLIHETIWRLDCRIVLTQNVDSVYDNYARTESLGTVLVKTYNANDVALTVRGDRRVILKAHGTVETPAEVIFTRQDYLRARYSHAAFYSLLDALAVTHTFLFIGCGLNDPDLNLLLERNAYMHSEGRPHYMLTTTAGINDDIRRSVEKNMNIRLITYQARDNHKELVDSLVELAETVELRRHEMAAQSNW